MSTEFVRFKTIFQIIVTMAPSVIKTKTFFSDQQFYK